MQHYRNNPDEIQDTERTFSNEQLAQIEKMKAEAMEIGVCAGDMCNRDGCTGIIDEHDDGCSCSCHINPPCSHCENHDQYCPECNWSNREDEAEERKKNKPTPEQIDVWKKEREDFEEKRLSNIQMVNDAYDGKIAVNKIVSYVTKTWHSGYAVKGGAPIGMTWEQIKIHFGCNYKEAMPRGSLDAKTGGFTLSHFTD